MESRKMVCLLHNTPNHQCRVMTKRWVEINENSRRIYNTNSPNELKTSILQSGLFNHTDPYIVFKETITLSNIEDMVTGVSNVN